MRYLAILALALLPACASFVTDPDTGETTFSAEGAALDIRSTAIIAEEAATLWTAADPELALKFQEIAVSLEEVAVVFDEIALGGDASPLEQMDAVLALLDVLLQNYVSDQEDLNKIGATIATLRAGIKIVKLRLESQSEATQTEP